MKPEEAIDYINIMLGNGCMWDGFTQDGKEAFMESLEMGKKALEKQVDPKYREAFKFVADFTANETHKRKYPHETVKKLSESLMLLNGYFKGEEVTE